MTAATDGRALGRATATITAVTALSRVTGFARTVVMAAVLGTSFLGNTYQSANTVPNLLFELFAAGALQAVLIPALVRSDADEGTEATDSAAGAVLGALVVLLGAVAVAGLVLSPLVMRLLVSGVADDGIRADQVALGTVFLLIFLPQLVLYAVGLVATGLLNARSRFAAPALSPVINNVVVMAAYGLFWILRDGEAPSLDLRPIEVAVLAGGTTLAVAAFTSLPWLACRRAGWSLRPRFDRRHPAVRRLARQGAWAAAYLGATQVLLLVVLVVANRAEGGVVAWQVAFTFFLLPHALLAVPVATTLFPSLSARAHGGDWDGFADQLARGLRAVVVLGLGASALLAGLAWPVVRTALFGEASDGVVPVARALVAFAPGLVAYGAFQLLTRASYALGEVRTPALVNAATVAVGAAAMVVAPSLAHGDALPAALAAIHSAVACAAAVALAVTVHRAVPARPTASWWRVLPGALVAAATTAVLAGGGAALADPHGRVASAGVAALLGAVGVAWYLGALRLAGGSPLRSLLALGDEAVPSSARTGIAAVPGGPA